MVPSIIDSKTKILSLEICKNVDIHMEMCNVILKNWVTINNEEKH